MVFLVALVNRSLTVFSLRLHKSNLPAGHARFAVSTAVPTLQKIFPLSCSSQVTLSYRLFPVLLSAAISLFAPAVAQQSVPLVPETLEQSAQPQLRGRLVLETIHSAALEQNLLGDSADRSLYVYLPPSYTTGQRRYPVLYFLRGYGGDYHFGEKIAPTIDRAFAAGLASEMIVVFLDGSNRLGGSFYADSLATGNFEQYVTEEIVSYVDRKYRTLPTPASRGLVGHSMGGNGALRLAMKHPEIYSVVYALNACCMMWADDFSLSNLAWNATLAMRSMNDFKRAAFSSRAFMSIGASWSANQQPPFFADLPVTSVDGKLAPVEQVAARWSAEMPVALVDPFQDNLHRLSGIGFEVGRQDPAHIITGAQLFSQALTRNGIVHQYLQYDGNHIDQYEGDHKYGVGERIATRVLPFLSEKLSFFQKDRFSNK